MANLDFNAHDYTPYDAPELGAPDKARKWSRFQTNIFDFIQYGEGNAIVEAVAGSGKSTTIVEGVKYAGDDTLLLAFNKTIAEELKSRGVNARTFHSITYGPVLKAVGAQRVTTDKIKRIGMQVAGVDEWFLYSSFLQKLVGLARQQGIGCLVPDVFDQWMNICIEHDLEPENELADIGRGIELAREILDASNASDMIDFDDMLYLAVRNNIRLPQYGFVFVDEAQDTNAIQRALLRKVLRPGGRMVAVGDPAQAIYGFRGADSNSMDLIASEFNCKRFPLSISYRCPVKVVEYARQWVDHIEPSPTAAPGVVTEMGSKWDMSMFGAGDLVVSRKVAPLMRLAYRFLREQVPVTVVGKEIGAGLTRFIRKFEAIPFGKFEAEVELYRDREIAKAKRQDSEAKEEAVNDMVDAVLCVLDSLPEHARSVASLLQVMDELFADKTAAVRLCSIHRSKGLEADNVFWLGRGECPATWPKQAWMRQQEVNLCYVATTRAKKKLVTFEL